MNPDYFPLSVFEVDCDGSACGSGTVPIHVHPPQHGAPAFGRVTVRGGKRTGYGPAQGITRLAAFAGSPVRTVIVRAVQTCFGCPSQWDAWSADGSQYYLRYRHSAGTAELVRRGPDEWLSEGSRVTVGAFGTDEEDGGVISLEEFCERAGLDLA